MPYVQVDLLARVHNPRVCNCDYGPMPRYMGARACVVGFSGLCVFSWSKMEMESVLKNPYKSNFFLKKMQKFTQKAQKMPPLPW